jgi:hypothetical protein
MHWQVAFVALAANIATAGFAAAPSHCLDLRSPRAEARLTGRLTVQMFAGPPNFESTARGDAEERSFILQLEKPICADDGEFVDAATSFDHVQVSASRDDMLAGLENAVGHIVTISGEAFGAQTAHHHAPLVIMAEHLALH